LHCAVDEAQSKAIIEGGVLTITMPKLKIAEKEKHRIKIESK